MYSPLVKVLLANAQEFIQNLEWCKKQLWYWKCARPYNVLRALVPQATISCKEFSDLATVLCYIHVKVLILALVVFT